MGHEKDACRIEAPMLPNEGQRSISGRKVAAIRAESVSLESRLWQNRAKVSAYNQELEQPPDLERPSIESRKHIPLQPHLTLGPHNDPLLIHQGSVIIFRKPREVYAARTCALPYFGIIEYLGISSRPSTN